MSSSRSSRSLDAPREARRSARQAGSGCSSRGRRKREDARHARLLSSSSSLNRSREPRLRGELDAALAQIEAEPASQRRLGGLRELTSPTYNGLLIDVGGLAPDQDASEGFIPSELAQRVHEHPLDTSLLDVSLRGYQAFGAKFALAQQQRDARRRDGARQDDRGARGDVPPRVEGRTPLPGRLPGQRARQLAPRDRAAHRPRRRCGCTARTASSNFRAVGASGAASASRRSSRLAWLYERDFDVSPALLVVDEAHYVKNPSARRTMAGAGLHRVRRARPVPHGHADGEPRRGVPQRSSTTSSRTSRAKVSAIDGLAGAATFRAAVAPVYLRRNQTDVLQELPPRIETEEWVDLRRARTRRVPRRRRRAATSWRCGRPPTCPAAPRGRRSSRGSSRSSRRRRRTTGRSSSSRSSAACSNVADALDDVGDGAAHRKRPAGEAAAARRRVQRRAASLACSSARSRPAALV